MTRRLLTLTALTAALAGTAVTFAPASSASEVACVVSPTERGDEYLKLCVVWNGGAQLQTSDNIKLYRPEDPGRHGARCVTG